MTIERKYSCNLCREQIPHDPASKFRGVGIYWISAQGWVEKSWRDTENHLCHKCISSIQAIRKVCGQGFQCDGGMNCQSDHK